MMNFQDFAIKLYVSMLLLLPEFICHHCQSYAGYTLTGVTLSVIDARCWPSVDSMGRTNGSMQSPLKQRVLIAFQLPSHSGSQSLLAGVTSPKDQGTKPGEQEGDR